MISFRQFVKIVKYYCWFIPLLIVTILSSGVLLTRRHDILEYC